MSAAGRLLGRSGPALVGGLIAAGSLPPLGWWPLGALGAALLFGSVRGAPLGHRLAVGFAFGLGQFGVALWFILQFSGFGFIILLVAESTFVALGSALVPGGRPIALAAMLCLAEWARGTFPFGGLPAGGLALGAAASPLGALARIAGPALLDAAVLLLGAGLAQLAAGLARHQPRGTAGGLLLIALVVACAALAGVAPRGGPALGVVATASVQGGGPRGLTSIEEPGHLAFARTDRVAKTLRRPVALEIWPEDTAPVPAGATLSRSATGTELARLARAGRLTLLAGVTQPVDADRFLNEEAAFGPTGALLGTVEKAHAVPFGEYVPWRGLISRLANLSAVPRDAIVGHSDGVLRTPAATLGVVISYEVFYPGRGRSEVRSGARLLVAPTNTASYAASQLPGEELDAARLQAIATGRDLLQVATTGYSALVGPSGDVAHRSNLGAADLLVLDVPERSGWTLYDRFGEWPALALSGSVLAFSWGAAAIARRRRLRGR